MKFLITFLAMPFALGASAQYYYKDIIGTREANEQMKHYREQKVRTVSLASFDADGVRNDILSIEQQFSGNQLITNTALDSNYSVLTTVLDEQGRVTKTIDSSEQTISSTTYEYGPGDQLMLVSSTTSDPARKFVQSEVHRWEWSNGRVSKMTRVKNGSEQIVSTFVYDEAGNMAEEHTRRAALPEDVVYYYYDASKRLTDIVRFSEKAKRLLPEYMFEYDESGRVAQRITVPANNSKYSIWRYQYDSRGLKIKEVLFDRSKHVNGKVEYTYTTGS